MEKKIFQMQVTNSNVNRQFKKMKNLITDLTYFTIMQKINRNKEILKVRIT